MNEVSKPNPEHPVDLAGQPVTTPLRLFYWSDAHNSYMPVEVGINKLEPFLHELGIDPNQYNHGRCIILRLFNMSDEEMANLPQV